MTETLSKPSRGQRNFARKLGLLLDDLGPEDSAVAAHLGIGWIELAEINLFFGEKLTMQEAISLRSSARWNTTHRAIARGHWARLFGWRWRSPPALTVGALSFFGLGLLWSPISGQAIVATLGNLGLGLIGAFFASGVIAAVEVTLRRWDPDRYQAEEPALQLTRAELQSLCAVMEHFERVAELAAHQELARKMGLRVKGQREMALGLLQEDPNAEILLAEWGAETYAAWLIDLDGYLMTPLPSGPPVDVINSARAKILTMVPTSMQRELDRLRDKYQMAK